MQTIEIPFKTVICKKCGGYARFAEKSKHMDKYKLYCSDCSKFIRFAKYEEKVLIKSREAWLREHDE